MTPTAALALYAEPHVAYCSGCHREYTAGAFQLLRFVGFWGARGRHVRLDLELRDCSCGSTISRRVS